MSNQTRGRPTVVGPTPGQEDLAKQVWVPIAGYVHPPRPGHHDVAIPHS